MRLISRNIHIILSILAICSYLLLLLHFSQTHQPKQKKLIENAEQEIIYTFSNAWLQTKIKEIERIDII